MPTLDALATPGGYAAALRALHAFHAAWEPAVWRAPGVDAAGLDEIGRRKLPLLERDLRALGIAPCAVRPPAPRLPDAAAALGALYVLEGATLGGRVIHRHVAGPLGLTPERAAEPQRRRGLPSPRGLILVSVEESVHCTPCHDPQRRHPEAGHA